MGSFAPVQGTVRGILCQSTQCGNDDGRERTGAGHEEFEMARQKRTTAVDKVALLRTILDEVESALAVMKQAAESARDAATHEENKPENDKDTRGLEAGYLAGAQAERALELNRTRDLVLSLVPRTFASDERIAALAIVELEDTDSDDNSRHFIVPVPGGKKFPCAGRVITVVSPASPLGDAIMGKRVGDVVEVPLGKKTKVLEIVALS